MQNQMISVKYNKNKINNYFFFYFILFNTILKRIKKNFLYYINIF